MGKPGNTGLRRIINATSFSFVGLRTAWRDEAAFRQEALLCVVLVPTAFWLGRTAVERSLLIGSCLLVLIVELLNSAIEWVIDYLRPEQHPLAKRIKDMASAAVFLSYINCIAVWVILLWPDNGVWRRIGDFLHR